jgi:hypothetical protein
VDVRHDKRLRFFPSFGLLSIELGGITDGERFPFVVFDNCNDLELDLFPIIGLDDNDVLQFQRRLRGEGGLIYIADDRLLAKIAVDISVVLLERCRKKMTPPSTIDIIKIPGLGGMKGRQQRG